MGLNRKIFVTTLVGFLLGAMLGIGALQMSKRGVDIPLLSTPEPPATVFVGTLSAACLGGTTPRVTLFWQSGSPRLVSIDRSEVGGPWESLALTEGDSHSYFDLTARADTKYRYRLSVDGTAASNAPEVATDAAHCAQ